MCLVKKTEKVIEFIDLLSADKEYTKTPYSLVKEMLDQLPEYLWKDKDKRFYDPCMGRGIFLLECFRRLMIGLENSIADENERAGHIASQMLFGSDIDHLQYYCALRSFEKITDRIEPCLDTRNILEEGDIDMKFDVICGNPPYNEPTTSDKHSTKQKGQKATWTKFVDKSWDLLNDDGYLVYVTPNNWLRETNYLKDIMKTKNLVCARIDSDKIKKDYFPEIGSTFTWFVINNSSKSLEPKMYIGATDGLKQLDISLDDVFPQKDLDETSLSIFRKVFNDNTGGIVGAWTREDEINEKYHKTEKTSTHIYRALYSGNKNNMYRWLNTPAKTANNHKAVIYRSSSSDVFYDYENSTTGNVYYSIFNSKDEAQHCVNLMNTVLYKFLIKNTKSAGAIVSVINKIPLIPYGTTVNEYQFFGLTQEEIDYVKERSK